MQRLARYAFVALCLGLCGCPAPRVPKGAVVLYDVDFSSPEQTPGAGVKTAEGSEHPFPRKLPSEIFSGHPAVVANLCGLSKQPAQLSASSGTQGNESLEFSLLGADAYSHYHVELDLCAQQVTAALTEGMPVVIFLDIQDAYAFGLMSGSQIGFTDPTHILENPSPRPIAKFVQGKPMHFTFDFDFEKRTLRATVDGKTVHEGTAQLSFPRSVRVLVRGDSNNVAGLDNVLIWADRPLPEPEAEPAQAPPTSGEKQE